MHFWVDADDYIKQAAANFTAGTGIIVKTELSPVGTHLTDLNARIQTDSVPEVFTMWPGASLNPYIESDVLLNLNDVNGEWKTRMSDTAKKDCSLDGNLYVAPVNSAFMGVAYNKAVFKKNNVAPPTNLADFESILAKLKQDTSLTTPIIMGSDCPNNYIYLMALSMVYQKYPDFDAKVKNGELSYNCPEVKNVYQKLFIDWTDYYNASSVASTDRMGKGAISFLDGKSAMIRLGSWDLNIMSELNENNTEFGMFPIPAADNKGSVLAATGEAFAISAFAKDAKKGATIELLNYLQSAKINAGICGKINSLSPYEGVSIEANPVISELQAYTDETARGWNVMPVVVQNKLGEAVDIIKASADKKQSVMETHLNLLDSIWKSN